MCVREREALEEEEEEEEDLFVFNDTVMMIVLLLFLQKQNLAYAVYQFGSVLSLPD